MADLSDKAKGLFEDSNILFVGTVNADGSPQVTPVWTALDNGHITFNTAVGRAKERNLRRDPRVGLSITAKDDPFKKVDIVGRGLRTDRRPLGEIHRPAPLSVAPGERAAREGRHRAGARVRNVIRIRVRLARRSPAT